jgi:hypothetical protein
VVSSTTTPGWPSFSCCTGVPSFEVQRRDLGLLLEPLVAGEGVARAGVFQRAVHLELAGRAARGLLLFHRGVEAGLVDAHAALAADVGDRSSGKP